MRYADTGEHISPGDWVDVPIDNGALTHAVGILEAFEERDGGWFVRLSGYSEPIPYTGGIYHGSADQWDEC